MAKYSKDSGSYVNFPSSAASNDAKASHDYGMDVAKAIEFQWFAKDGNNTRFYANKQRFHSLKLYAQGDQDIRRYKDELSFQGDLSYLNLDWTPVPIIPKFVDIVVNGMANRGYTVQANATDPTSVAEKGRYIKRLRAEMENRELLEQMSIITGVDLFENKPEGLPGSEEEVQLRLQLDYKQNAELAIEAAVDYEFKKNRFKNTKTLIDYDLVVLGIGAARCDYNNTEGIVLKHVDPANLVYSDSESNFYDDCYYFGEVERVHISEIQKEFPHLTQDQLETLVKRSGQYYDFNNIPYNQQSGDSQMVDTLRFCYKTTNNEIYKIKETTTGGMKALEKDENFLPPKDKRTGFEKTSRANEVVYEGVKVLGSEIMLKWELAKNMVRPSNNSPKVIMPYVIASPRQYKGKLYSLVRRMEKYADQIQLTELKIMQTVQRMTPSGIYLDVDGLMEVDLGNGSSYNAQEALNMYFQTGSVVGRSMTDEAGFNNGRVPIQELGGSTGIQLQPLFARYNQLLEQIRNVTGLNEARDGTQPDPNALVGTQKLAAANSNTATRNILFASTYILETLAEATALRTKDVIEFSDTKEDYINAIGVTNVELLDELAELHYNEFGIFIELGPDEEEKQLVEANIQQALARDLLTPEDAIDVRRITNPKVANQMLKLRRQQRDAARQEEAQANIEAQANAQAEASTRIEEAKAQAYQVEAQSKGQLAQLEAKLETEKLMADEQVKMRLMEKEHRYNLEILNIQQGHSTDEGDKSRAADMTKEKVKQGGTGDITKPFESAGNDRPGGINLGNFEPK